MSLLKNALVFASGYLLGSRAGRERYLQLVERGRALLQRRRARGSAAAATSTDIDDLTEAELDALTAPDPGDGTPPER